MPVAVSPIEEPGFTLLPGAVEEGYFQWGAGNPAGASPPRLAALHRTGLRAVIEQTLARLHRTREGHRMARLRPSAVPAFLVPPNDANELAHAILAALFKPEFAQQKIDAARQTREKFRPRQRLRVLTQVYESLRR